MFKKKVWSTKAGWILTANLYWFYRSKEGVIVIKELDWSIEIRVRCMSIDPFTDKSWK